jgi:hypothetical protein
MESEETSIVNLRVITQKWSCNSALNMRKGRKERYENYEIYTARQKYIICIHQRGSKSLQHPSTLPTIPFA